MPNATFQKFDCLTEDLAHKKHNLSSDQLKIALTNTAPTSSNSTLADITEIDYTYLSSRNLTTVTSSQTNGTYTLDLADITLSASGGNVGPFRYVVIYNDTATNDELIAFFDYGSSVTINDGENLEITFDASGLFQITPA